MNSKTSVAIISIAIYLITTPARAHFGHDAAEFSGINFLNGLLHPLTGVDHLAAMLAVGLWSALTARRLWTAPLAFAAMLLVGALLGLSGMALPALEPMMAASLLVLGLLVALRARLPAAAAAALVGGFAVFHGVAHGTELAGASAPWAPLVGMLITTVALHAAGLALGLSLRHRSPVGSRLAGVAVTLLGGVLLLQMA
jgi:urease accessory protein